MGKYQAYPEYKDSGVEWLDNLPSHWETVALKMLIDVRDGTHDTPAYVEPSESSYPLVTSKDVTGGEINLTSCKQISEEDYNSIIKRSAVSIGDILMPMIGTVGSPILIESNSNIAIKNLALFKTSAESNQLDTKYLLYFLNSNECSLQFSLESRGGVQSFVSLGTLRNLGLPFVPPSEQQKIANFLDHETAKIDALIEKQQQLISLLQEKRQAVISHAVTKGLNPDVPMKDSGVEWLGEVPEHWVVSRIKNFAKIDSGHTPSRQVEEYWIDCNIPWVSLSDSKTLKIVDYIDDTSNKINELGMANSSAHLLPERSVVFTRDASIGLSAIISKPMAVSQHLIAWICNDSRLIPEFLLLIFYAMEKEFERYTFGATIKTIGMDDVRSLSGAFPPLEEQRVLVEWAFQKIASLKNGIDKAESIVELLKERRTALISAAVTGKIDVRNWQAPSQSPSTSTEEQAL
ncbi:restriction endonuclease subunit S [Plesiomonas shigelloides]|uniref:restriction endonuclease subunit S n=1 Tax=Plesiomonas shigelloides TaxID=703 RepID=UPI000A1202BB|nr:restriction endonuclease subunit S [Plesiomonas shigelloides]